MLLMCWYSENVFANIDERKIDIYLQMRDRGQVITITLSSLLVLYEGLNLHF